jgi:ubiquinol-cytochrome c reductase iron-sulfur subunit
MTALRPPLRMTALRALLACLALSSAALPGARADDYPQGLVREQLEQASRRLEVDLSRLGAGELLTVEYVGRPVYVYRRTEADRAYLAKRTRAHLADPSGANMLASVHAAYGSSASLVWARLLLVDQPALEKRRARSYRDEYLVVAGWDPRSGCRLEFNPAARRTQKDVVFTDSCLKEQFDAAGRSVRNGSKGAAEAAPAYNLYIPPHRYESRSKLVIGLRPGAILPELGFSHASLYRDADPAYNLIIAARYDDLGKLESALSEGADINSFRAEEGSPLDAAIIGSRIDTVKLLIDRGARPTGRSMRAAEFIGRKEVWEMLERIEPKEGTR